MSKCVVPISGGLDSTVILHKALARNQEIHAVTFNYGQRHYAAEVKRAIDTCSELSVKSHKVIDITFFRDIVTTSSLTNDEIDVAKTRDVLGDPQTVNYVPNRNMMMLSICTAYAESLGAGTVYHGSALVDSQAGYWDGSIEFINAINNVNALNRRDRVNIEAPLIKKSKREIIQDGVKLGVDFGSTWTCYNGGSRACGECPACSSRIQGFLDAGYIDPIEYDRDIPWNKYNAKPIIRD
jgi:7-cyano-7-deazaguanine synthase